jgi:hypothetical protein
LPGVKPVRPVSLRNLLKRESKILKLDLRTNKRDKFLISPDTSSFAEKPEASTLY